MFKYVVVLALIAAASAAPQILLRSAAVLDNEGAKQVGLPYANGWTDGPNNGVGPVVHVAAAPIVHSVHSAPITYAAHTPIVAAHHGLTYAAAGHHFVL